MGLRHGAPSTLPTQEIGQKSIRSRVMRVAAVHSSLPPMLPARPPPPRLRWLLYCCLMAAACTAITLYYRARSTQLARMFFGARSNNAQGVALPAQAAQDGRDFFHALKAGKGQVTVWGKFLVPLCPASIDDSRMLFIRPSSRFGNSGRSVYASLAVMSSEDCKVAMRVAARLRPRALNFRGTTAQDLAQQRKIFFEK